jgi:curli biogenesis system outer membrane secretion channel CsgG
VAVLDFDYATVRQQFASWNVHDGLKPALDTWDVGKGISDLLVDELLTTGAVRLFERKKLDAVLSEQDFSNSNRADLSAGTVVKLGRASGVQYIVVGSITKFGGEEKTKGGAAGAIAGKLLLGGFGLKQTFAHVGLTCRVVDASTGEIIASVRAEGQSSRKGMLLGGLAGGFGGIGGGGFSMGSSGFQETILGEATNKAVKDAATKLAAELARQ